MLKTIACKLVYTAVVEVLEIQEIWVEALQGQDFTAIQKTLIMKTIELDIGGDCWTNPVAEWRHPLPSTCNIYVVGLFRVFRVDAFSLVAC